MTPSASQQVAAEIDRHPNKPRAQRLIRPERRPLDRAHKRLLNKVVRIRGIARHSITQAPKHPAVSFKSFSVRTHRLRSLCSISGLWFWFLVVVSGFCK
jgi:hypothetical protein